VNNKNILAAVIAVVLLQLAWLDVASAFSFCFSFGSGAGHRARNHYRSMPAIGFDPGYWQTYPNSQVTTSPYAIPSTPLPAQARDLPGMSTPWQRR